MNMNLLEKTREELAAHGLTFEDVVWIGMPDREIPVETFMRLANKEYDHSCGGAEVSKDLVVCGTGWWLERCEYDDAKWWEYKMQPKRPGRVVVPERIIAYDIPEAEASVPLPCIEQGTIPRYLPKEGVWTVRTANGVERGSLEYVCGEFADDGLIYHFRHTALPEYPDHVHTFAGVLRAVLADPKGFSLEGFEGEYSQQEQYFLQKLQQRMQEELKLLDK